MYCSKCGKEIEEGERFCSSCGERTDGEVDFNKVVNTASAKAKENMTKVGDKVKAIDTSDVKTAMSSLTKQDCIVYTVVGFLMILVGLPLIATNAYNPYRVLPIHIFCSGFSIIFTIILYIYLYIAGKLKRSGGLQVLLIVSGVLSLVSFIICKLMIEPNTSVLVVVLLFCMLRCIVSLGIGCLFSVFGIRDLVKYLKTDNAFAEMNISRPDSNINSHDELQSSQGLQNGQIPQSSYRAQGGTAQFQDIRFDYTPISMWGYFLYNILFMIPLIGFICLVIFSVGGTRNINLRNYARSWFCVVILAIVVFLFCAVLVALSSI